MDASAILQNGMREFTALAKQIREKDCKKL
jgi:hypothetical protein